MPRKYRMTVFWVLMGVNLLFHIGPFLSVMNMQGAQNTTVNLANIPPEYNFLMFPANSVVIYKTEQLLATEKVGNLSRAVSAEYQEIKNGAVGVIDEGFVPVSDLRYLPEGDAQKYIKDWQNKIASSGYYTAGRWDAKDLPDGHKLVILELRDDKHARSYTYSYETDGNNLFNISPVRLASGIAMAAIFMVCIRFLFFAGVIWFIIVRIFRN